MKNTENTSSVVEPTLRMHPKKFALWLFLVSVIMIFASMTSAYIVRMSEGNWLYFELPTMFYYSTCIVILSSVAMHWAYVAAKKDNFFHIKGGLIATAVLGITFLYLQIKGWEQMVAMSVYLVGNPSGSFVYVITGLHGLHIVSAIIVVLFTLVSAFRMKIHAKNMLQISMCATYWHFLGILWIYLFVFMLIYR
ncbi:MAG: cytochrome c oxidase subunit 3 [Cytophagales bacterium]|nr:cytochrome c oxidase subunit 3 [Cytophagales bacterium]MDW8383988.1 cytochrome c oxidase subunit 3 [Flammeovirgaceae bacterium]